MHIYNYIAGKTDTYKDYQKENFNLKNYQYSNQIKSKYIGAYIKIEEIYNKNNKRNLAGVTAAAQSTITGTGRINFYYLGVSSFNINTSTTISVTAKDSSSTNVGYGNDIFYVEITNACTKGNNYEWVANSGRDTVLTSDITKQLYDNLDGTYYYTYSVSRPGAITISVILYTLGGVYSEYYTNPSSTGNNAYNTTTETQINFSWAGNVFLTYSTNLSAKYYFRFMSPVTDTVTFTLQSDDNSTFTLDGSLLITNNCWSSTTGSISLIKNQYYKGYVAYTQISSTANLYLKWSYTGQATTVIPATSLYYPAYVGSSPIQLTVTCPSFYTPSSASGTPSWIVNWGDGLRYTTESCDDGNSISGDGCSNTWTNESGYICNGGSTTSKDTCSKCAYGYINNSSYTSCDLKTISNYAKWLAISTWCVVVIGIIWEILNSIVTKTPPLGAYFVLEHIQIFIMIPAIGLYFTDDLYGFIRLMRHAFLSYDFISIESVFFRSYTYAQDSTILNLLGFESSSTAVNWINYILGLAAIVVIQLLWFRIYGALEESNKKSGFYDFLSTLSQWFFLGAYFRYLLLGTVLVFMSATDELNNKPQNKNRWSWGLALTFIIVYGIIWIWSVIYSILSKINDDLSKSTYFVELINGVKTNIFAKFYTSLFLLHRVLLVTLFVPSIGISTENSLIASISLQGFYFIVLIAVRPFVSLRHNIIKNILRSCDIHFICASL